MMFEILWRGGVACFLTLGWMGTSFIHAADWPQFRGPNRDGKSLESGLLKQWPENRPGKFPRTSSVFFEVTSNSSW